MLKSAVGLVAVVALTLLTAGTAQRGCQDARKSLTKWSYFPIRDMRTSVAILPQKVLTRRPDSLSVPTTGIARTYGLEGIELANKLGETLKNPAAADDSSIARGERKFRFTCVPCHGKALAGDGPVAASFMPPPDLLAEATRQRSDGYIFSYIRNGGAVMPSYGPQVTPEEAWNLVNYIRQMQRVSPR